MGAALCLFLPETLGKSIPNTLEEAERFGEGENFYNFACCDGKALTESTTVLHSVKNDDVQTVSAQINSYESHRLT